VGWVWARRIKLEIVLVTSAATLSGAVLPGQQPEAELRDAPEKPVVTRVCGECHDPAPRITKFRKSETEWADVITDMQNRGMMADDKELEVVLAYLTRNYGR
jgi:hypothetical protein